MELFQVFWDDQENLFLEFEKDEEEQVLLLPNNLKRINFQYEISKILRNDIHSRQPPDLISIKKIYHSDDYLCFTIKLDEVSAIDDLQFKILGLTIYLYNGNRIEYTFSEKFNISDVSLNEDCYFGYQFFTLGANGTQSQTYTKEKVIQEIKTDFSKNTEERKVIYEKNSIATVSIDNQSLLSMIKENNETLKSIEFHIKNLTKTLMDMSINTASFGPPRGVPQRIPGPVIERIKSPQSPSLIQNRGSSAKILVIKEMKDIFQKTTDKNNGFSIKDILKPMSNDELRLITLDDEELQKREAAAIKNQIKRLENKKNDEIQLEDLKKPE